MRLEFDDSILVSHLVGNILKSEVKAKQKIARTRFDQIHKLYLKQISKPKVRAKYEGKYILVCSNGCINSHENTTYHFEIATTIEAIRAVFDLHIDHDFVLLHESVIKRKSISKLKTIHKLLRVKELLKK